MVFDWQKPLHSNEWIHLTTLMEKGWKITAGYVGILMATMTYDYKSRLNYGRTLRTTFNFCKGLHINSTY